MISVLVEWNYYLQINIKSTNVDSYIKNRYSLQGFQCFYSKIPKNDDNEKSIDYVSKKSI